MPAIKDAIELTDEEHALFQELLDASKQAGLSTTLRCAGGWVRDKLMGRTSLDIDIALDNLLGREFADRINEYLKAHGEETHHVAVIMSNPEQSKHLETARMKVRGIWIDLVNLRSEEYALHSRIPTMTFGTPEEDAHRRDFTINTLFYNINTGLIEDFTQQGLADLRAGIIRTPMQPKETFMDDPLRVLRAVRFASRFGFELEERLLEAAADDEVRYTNVSKFEGLLRRAN
ncbi:CCA tRNA nucleotidyltransferase 2 [Micractinium conductrix]|uniref:CCA tRNA nucleotidyltransferase 2 n=1 Tax=Micractinium conductrix TaxID=554055 RepID=A0A2P6VSB2_9CHLO|nr:CCA tRNA nucleotidyltransferase 2 [Micractinium conductrix]|eukprot:PSC76981.1 CCA tRNA nucleotidyltransferase 2 [Micractinium conductrix]